MSSDSTNSNKLNVLDPIVTILREQEKALDELAGRLSKVLGALPKIKGV